MGKLNFTWRKPNFTGNANFTFAKQILHQKGISKMDEDVVRIYEKLYCKYPIALTSAWKKGFHSDIDFPILTATSVLGSLEMSCDDVPSFAFYVTDSNGDFLAHFHLKTALEAEKWISDFMNGKLSLISFGQQHNI